MRLWFRSFLVLSEWLFLFLFYFISYFLVFSSEKIPSVSSSSSSISISNSDLEVVDRTKCATRCANSTILATARLRACIRRNQKRVVSLNKSLKSIDSGKYKRDNPWADEVQERYDRYKTLQAALGPAHRQYTDYPKPRRQPTPEDQEEHLRAAKLALEWGDTALEYVMVMLPKCYPILYRSWPTR